MGGANYCKIHSTLFPSSQPHPFALFRLIHPHAVSSFITSAVRHIRSFTDQMAQCQSCSICSKRCKECCSIEKFVMRRNALEAYERFTGFAGIGRFMAERGAFEIVEGNGCQEK